MKQKTAVEYRRMSGKAMNDSVLVEIALTDIKEKSQQTQKSNSIFLLMKQEQFLLKVFFNHFLQEFSALVAVLI